MICCSQDFTQPDLVLLNEEILQRPVSQARQEIRRLAAHSRHSTQTTTTMKQNSVQPSVDNAIRPFQVRVVEDKLTRIRQRVPAVGLDALAEPPDAADWRYGPPTTWMHDLCAYWSDGYARPARGGAHGGGGVP